MFALDSILIAAGGLIVGIGWVNNQEWMHPAIKAAVRFILYHAPGAENKRLLKEIMKELRPNGGSSIKDSLDRVERSVEVVTNSAQTLLKMQRITEEHQGIFTFLTDENGACTYANRHYLEHVGLTLEEVQNYGWKNIINCEERVRVLEEWAHVIRDGRDFHMNITYTNYQTGKTSENRVDAYVVKNGDSVVGWVGYVNPITGRR